MSQENHQERSQEKTQGASEGLSTSPKPPRPACHSKRFTLGHFLPASGSACFAFLLTCIPKSLNPLSRPKCLR
jgi:hypothetical protein